jgi:two-component system response regulator AgrA
MINILICDDCSRTVELIKNIVNQFYDEIDLKDFSVQTFNNSKDITTYVKNNSIEKNIYILDIDLNEEKNGLLLGREIRKLDNYCGEMIFVTSHLEMSFKVFQYKLRVLEFIDKTCNLSKQLKESLSIATTIICKNAQENKEKKLQVKSGIHIFNIPIKNVIYFETIKNSNKIILCTCNNRIEFYSTLKELKNSLDDNFIQVHKTTIVNKNYIRNINKSPNNLYVELENGVQCPVSRSGLKVVSDLWTC